MASDWVDFRTVKASVTMLQILDHYGVRLRKVNANSLRGKCPLPMHSSEGSDVSFGVDIEKQVWACQSDSCVKERNGRRGGNVLDFVALKEGVSVRDAALKLASWFSISSPGPSKTADAKHVEPVKESKPEEPAALKETNLDQSTEANRVLTFALKGIDPSHHYLKARGVSEETARHFGVGHFPGNGSMKDRIVFPIRNRGGEILAYAGRAINDATDPRWKFPAGFRKSLELFGVANIPANQKIVVVESFWGVLALHQIDISAVALMGRSMSPDQEDLLLSLSPSAIIVLLDGDEPGRAAAPEVAIRLARRGLVRIIELPNEKQPDHLSADELRAVFA